MRHSSNKVLNFGKLFFLNILIRLFPFFCSLFDAFYDPLTFILIYLRIIFDII